MIPKFYVPAESSEIQTDLATVAIDLSGAYAEPAPAKTGYFQPAWGGHEARNGPCTQAEAASWFTSFLNHVAGTGGSAVNLILEAPLSYACASRPNRFPLNAQRRSVERKTNYTNPDLITDDRPWIRNAGAATALVALLFLNAIRPHIPKGITVQLFEGLWSWIPAKTRHQDDVHGLAEGIKVGRVVAAQVGPGQISHTALDLLGDTSPTASRPPLIVFGHPDLATAYNPTSP